MARERFRIEFEELGADKVRHRLLRGLWDEEKRRHALQWLDYQELREEREFRRYSSRIARSAKNAAWIAATAAIIAAISAVYVILFGSPTN